MRPIAIPAMYRSLHEYLMENHKQRRIIRMEICRCIGVDRASSFVFVHDATHPR
jgi:hypothetical protein